MGIEEVLFYQMERNLRCLFVALQCDIVVGCYLIIFVNKTHPVIVVIGNLFFYQDISVLVFFLCCNKFRSVDCRQKIDITLVMKSKALDVFDDMWCLSLLHLGASKRWGKLCNTFARFFLTVPHVGVDSVDSPCEEGTAHKCSQPLMNNIYPETFFYKVRK